MLVILANITPQADYLRAMMKKHSYKPGVHTGIRPGWLDVLDENHVQFMVLDPVHDTVLIEQLNDHTGWIVEYASEEAIFYVRDEMIDVIGVL
jgi:hypothetical protein